MDDTPADLAHPSLGSLSLSAVLAIALAALRGTATLVSDWRQRRMERDAEEAVWREARLKRRAAEEDAAAKVAKVPSSAEYGRKTVQDGRRTAAGPGKGSAGGKTPGPGATGGLAKKPGTAGPVPPTKVPDKPRLADPPKPKPRTPDRPTVPAERHGGKDGRSKGPKDGGTKKPGPTTDKPAKPSAGILAPGKGKGSGGAGKGALERARDRKAGGDGAVSPRGDKTGSGRKGKGSGKPDVPGTDKVGRRTGAGPKTDGSDVPGDSSHRKGSRTRNTRPKKRVPGVKHGTADAHDVHECRCRRCVRAAAKRAKAEPATSTGPGPSSPGGNTGRAGRRRGRTRKGRDRHTPGVGPTDQSPPPGASGGRSWAPPPPRGARRSAEEDLHSATAWTETVITVERADRPGDAERRQAPEATAVTTGPPGLPRAPEQPAGPRPGTARTTKETPVGAPSIRLSAPAGAAAEHLTEVTLDDVLDHLAASKKRCFATYDECARLAEQARKLRRSLEELSHELAERHNIIGRLTSQATARLAEVMDVVARKAEAMRDESLTAAESVETAHDAMHDAYRPVQDAAADAGLVMPSARIHNED
ncbi:hypothetical protein [Streptomyces lavendulocolor]|uniref:hypothetical protein n=1 Tax=Streptomyces lavendulocolor TaxID=67316 RepID=UPI003C2D2B4A